VDTHFPEYDAGSLLHVGSVYGVLGNIIPEDVLLTFSTD
jgi:hypothetical protein